MNSSGWAQQMSPQKTLALRRKVAAANMAVDQDLASTPVTKRYLICSTQRSGSTLLTSLLDQTGLAGRPMEYFNEVYIEAFCARLGIPTIRLDRYIPELEHWRATPNGVFGTKAHLWQLQSWLRTEKLPPLQQFLSGFHHLIFLKRRSPLNQAISLDRAVQTGHWSSQHTKLADEPAADPVFDPLMIVESLKMVLMWEEQWRNVFRKLTLSPIEICYEDIIADPEGEIRGLLASMGIETATASLIKPGSTSQSDRHNSDFRDRLLALLSR